MLKRMIAALSAAVMVAVMVPSTLAFNPGEVVESLNVAIAPLSPYEGLNFTVTVSADAGFSDFVLPPMEFPEVSDDPTPEEREAFMAAVGELYDYFDSGEAQYVSLMIYRNDDGLPDDIIDAADVIYGKKMFVEGDSDVIVTDDGDFQLTVPVIRDNLNTAPGVYTVVVSRFQSYPEDPESEVLETGSFNFNIKTLNFPNFDLNLDPIFVPGGFFDVDDAEAELLVPTSLVVVPSTAFVGTDVAVTVLGQDGETPIELSGLYYIDIWPSDQNWGQDSIILSTDSGVEGVEVGDQDGTYVFKAPVSGEYNVGLYDGELGNGISFTATLKTKLPVNVPAGQNVGAANLNDLLDVEAVLGINLDGVLDLSDLVEEGVDEGIGEVVDGGGNGGGDVVDGGGVADDVEIAVEDQCAGFLDVALVSGFCEAITWAKENSVVSGYPDGSFKEDNDINRVEMLKVVLESLNIELEEYDEEVDGDLGFSDVFTGQWYMPYIKTGKKLGIFVGDAGKGTARPGDTVNRVEALKMAFEGVVAAGGDEIEACDAVDYEDVDAEEWYFVYTCAAQEYTLFDLEDAKNMEPGKLSIRGEVVLMLFRLSEAGVLTIE